MGKGSKRRRALVPKEVVDRNWKATFEKKDESSTCKICLMKEPDHKIDCPNGPWPLDYK